VLNSSLDRFQIELISRSVKVVVAVGCREAISQFADAVGQSVDCARWLLRSRALGFEVAICSRWPSDVFKSGLKGGS
jgi:hypothetical protein